MSAKFTSSVVGVFLW